MALYVQKYGGTSVGSIEKIQYVTEKILKTRSEGHEVVVVVSAMGKETDRLLDLARNMTPEPDPRELDVLVSTGEQVSIALLAISLIARGCPARSYTGSQVKILTSDVYNKARILHIDEEFIRQDLANGKVVIVAGFQGVDPGNNITTLGRGGSDTTAVALAALLHADECLIYTDVNGIYTADPRIVPSARRLDRITFEEVLELSSLGSKVINNRAVQFAGKYKVPVRVLSTFSEDTGTLISFEDKNMEQPIVSGVTFDADEAKLTIRKVPDRAGIGSTILGPVSDANIVVDMIIQNTAADGTIDFTFTVNKNDFSQAKHILEKSAHLLGAEEVLGDEKIVKVSIVGVGMRSHAGIATTMFKALANEGISIQLISTSEIKVSVVIEEKYLELAVRALHTAFGLDVKASPKSLLV
ncbi:MAG: aspartate kinase [Gammaproteobacteria bacterium]|nr:aspartate kinase [Gammaproteobacteria bacterium]